MPITTPEQFTEMLAYGKKEETNYKDGKKDGLWNWWYENGQKEAELIYKDGKLISRKGWDEVVVDPDQLERRDGLMYF